MKDFKDQDLFGIHHEKSKKNDAQEEFNFNEEVEGKKEPATPLSPPKQEEKKPVLLTPHRVNENPRPPADHTEKPKPSHQQKINPSENIPAPHPSPTPPPTTPITHDDPKTHKKSLRELKEELVHSKETKSSPQAPPPHDEKKDKPAAISPHHAIHNKIKTIEHKTPPAGHKQKHQPHRIPLVFKEGVSVGHFLQEARVNLDRSVDQIAIATKIRKSYIEALEQDNFKELPPPVYVTTYIRRLCEEYGINDEETTKLIQHTKDKHISHTVPEEILLGIEKGKQISFDKRKRLKTFKIIISAAALILTAIIAAAIITGISWKKTKAINSSANKETTVSKQMSPATAETELKKIILTYPLGNMSELELDK